MYISLFRTVASSINMEFRDINKFVAPLGGSVVIVTDSWILQTNVHSVDIIHQRDAVLQLVLPSLPLPSIFPPSLLSFLHVSLFPCLPPSLPPSLLQCGILRRAFTNNRRHICSISCHHCQINCE